MMARRELKMQRLKAQMDAETRLKDPEAINPSFKPQLSSMSRVIAMQLEKTQGVRSQYDKTKTFIGKREEKANKIRLLKQQQELAECSFFPQTSRKKSDQYLTSSTTRSLDTDQLKSFLKRNLDEHFSQKQARLQAMDQHFYRNLKSKPTIGERSRKIMRSITPENV